MRARQVGLWGSFGVCVLAPALAAGVYYAALAPGLYSTQARLVVRTIGLDGGTEDAPGRVRMLGGGAVVQDAHILVDYLTSRAVVRDLHQGIGLAHRLTPPVPHLGGTPDWDRLHRQWLRQTTSTVDGPSGIITFSVRADTPDGAVTLAQAAIAQGARLIETLSDGAKADLVARARGELDLALARYTTQLDALRQVQNSLGVLDPQADAAVATQLIADLLAQRLDADAKLANLRASGVRRSPIITRLQRTVDALSQQIDQERAKLTDANLTGPQSDAGPRGDALSGVLAQLQALDTERTLAEALYASASRMYDTAQSNAAQQSTFVSVFAPPPRPQRPSHPRRLALWVMVCAGALALWASAVLIWAAIQDHREDAL